MPSLTSLDYRIGPKYPYIEVSRNYEPDSLTECIRKAVNEYREKIADIKVVKVETNSVLSGYPAYELVYTQQIGKIRKSILKCIEAGTVVNDMKYSVNYVMDQENFQQYYDVFSIMKDSLSIYK